MPSDFGSAFTDAYMGGIRLRRDIEETRQLMQDREYRVQAQQMAQDYGQKVREIIADPMLHNQVWADVAQRAAAGDKTLTPEDFSRAMTAAHTSSIGAAQKLAQLSAEVVSSGGDNPYLTRAIGPIQQQAMGFVNAAADAIHAAYQGYNDVRQNEATLRVKSGEAAQAQATAGAEGARAGLLGAQTETENQLRPGRLQQQGADVGETIQRTATAEAAEEATRQGTVFQGLEEQPRLTTMQERAKQAGQETEGGELGLEERRRTNQLAAIAHVMDMGHAIESARSAGISPAQIQKEDPRLTPDVQEGYLSRLAGLDEQSQTKIRSLQDMEAKATDPQEKAQIQKEVDVIESAAPIAAAWDVRRKQMAEKPDGGAQVALDQVRNIAHRYTEDPFRLWDDLMNPDNYGEQGGVAGKIGPTGRTPREEALYRNEMGQEFAQPEPGQQAPSPGAMSTPVGRTVTPPPIQPSQGPQGSY